MDNGNEEELGFYRVLSTFISVVVKKRLWVDAKFLMQRFNERKETSIYVTEFDIPPTEGQYTVPENLESEVKGIHFVDPLLMKRFSGFKETIPQSWKMSSYELQHYEEVTIEGMLKYRGSEWGCRSYIYAVAFLIEKDIAVRRLSPLGKNYFMFDDARGRYAVRIFITAGGWSLNEAPLETKLEIGDRVFFPKYDCEKI